MSQEDATALMIADMNAGRMTDPKALQEASAKPSAAQTAAQKKVDNKQAWLGSIKNQATTLQGGVGAIDQQANAMRERAEAEKRQMRQDAARALSAMQGQIPQGSGAGLAALRSAQGERIVNEGVTDTANQSALADLAGKRLEAQMDAAAGQTAVLEAEQKVSQDEEAQVAGAIDNVDTIFAKSSDVGYTDADARRDRDRAYTEVLSQFVPGSIAWQRVKSAIDAYVSEEVD